MHQSPGIFVISILFTSLFSLALRPSTIVANEDAAENETAAVSTFEKRLLSFDRNQDGLLQRSELADKNHQKFDAWDYDRNGVLDQDEQDVLIYFEKNGKLPEGELRNRIENSLPDDRLQLEDGYYHRPGGNLTVGEFVGRALTFDKDNSGTLDQDELIKMAQAFIQIERLNRARRHQANRVGASSQGLASTGSRVQNRQSYLSGLHSQVQPPVRSRRSAATTRGTRGGGT